MTPLDHAHAAMAADEDDEAARRAFYLALAAAELVLAIEPGQPADDTVRPVMVETAEGRFALAFDTEARLADVFPEGAGYAALPGRRLAALLADQGIGLALNPGVAPSEFWLGADALAWLAGRSAGTATLAAGRLDQVARPRDVPPVLLDALANRLPLLAPICARAYLAQTAEGLTLALVDVPEPAEAAALQAIGEMMRILGLPDDVLAVAMIPGDGPIPARLDAHAIRYDLAPAEQATPPRRDPDRPPRLV